MRDNAIYNEFVERVRAQSDIVAVVSDYVSLKKNGKNYWGCCPFHNEKTPSFSVTPDKGFFYCFGCHVGGNVFNFLMRMENIPYYEAVKFLAGKLNIPLPQRDKTPQEIAREREMAKLKNVHEMAGAFFYSCLTKTNYGKSAKAYLQGRGVGDETIESFKLGFAPNAWDKLSSALLKRGFDDEVLVKAGLSVERKSDGIYDRFRNRVMFPICNERGAVLGFGGRVMDDSQPKYLNSPETAIFNKRRIVFGLDQAWRAIKESGKAIIVEGYMDAITAHSHNIRNVVASLGTSFTPEQCKKILKYGSELLFAYDSDSAGQNATIRALSIARAAGANVKVVVLPDGKDPDEFIRKHGAKAFLQLTASALPLPDYQITRAMTEFDAATLEGKVAIIATVIPVLADTQNAVETNVYIARLSQTLGVDESAVRAELRKYLSRNQKDNNVKKGQNIKMDALVRKVDTAVLGAGRHIIRLLWDDNSIIPYVEAKLAIDEFQNEEHREILQFLMQSYHDELPLDDVAASLALNESANAELSHCMAAAPDSEDLLKLLEDCIKTIHLAYLKILYERHCRKADELQRLGDGGFLQELAESQRIRYEIDKMHE